MTKQEKSDAVYRAALTKGFYSYLSADWANSLQAAAQWGDDSIYESVADMLAWSGTESDYASLLTPKQRRLLDENIANKDVVEELAHAYIYDECANEDKLFKMYAEEYLGEFILSGEEADKLTTNKEIDAYVDAILSLRSTISEEAAEALRARLKDALKKINKRIAKKTNKQAA